MKEEIMKNINEIRFFQCLAEGIPKKQKRKGSID